MDFDVTVMLTGYKPDRRDAVIAALKQKLCPEDFLTSEQGRGTLIWTTTVPVEGDAGKVVKELARCVYEAHGQYCRLYVDLRPHGYPFGRSFLEKDYVKLMRASPKTQSS